MKQVNGDRTVGKRLGLPGRNEPDDGESPTRQNQLGVANIQAPAVCESDPEWLKRSVLQSR